MSMMNRFVVSCYNPAAEMDSVAVSVTAIVLDLMVRAVSWVRIYFSNVSNWKWLLDEKRAHQASSDFSASVDSMAMP